MLVLRQLTVLAAVVLAAGAASRFGSPKQALFLPSVLERVRAAGLAEIVVVLGAHELDLVFLKHKVSARHRFVRCSEWKLGPGASLRCGVRTLAEDIEAAVVVLADGPYLSPLAIERVVAAWRETGAPLVAASYGGARGHPLVLARPAWTAIPDEGLRSQTPLLVPCDDLGAPGDVDETADLPERFGNAPGEPM